MKHTRRPGSAGAEPDVVLPAGDETRAAGREGAFFRQGCWSAPLRQRRPRRAAIIGDDQVEPPVHGVAQCNAVLLVPKSDCVKERFRLSILELELPSLA